VLTAVPGHAAAGAITVEHAALALALAAVAAGWSRTAQGSGPRVALAPSAAG
jgi:hypothetical protein